MKKILKYACIILCSATVLAACDAQQMLQNAQEALRTGAGSSGVSPVTQKEAALGIKEALTKGVTAGVNTVGVKDGFFQNAALKIFLPPEAQKVETRLRDLGFGNLVDDAIESLNRGAEEASKEAKPIFVNAIKQMTITDAFNIVKGEKDACTQFLRRTTSKQLYNKFEPVVKRNLDKVNATKYWGDVFNTYNKIPFVDKVNPDLTNHVTEKAIDGLFVMIEKEEGKIRENPLQRTTELLKRVFGLAD